MDEVLHFAINPDPEKLVRDRLPRYAAGHNQENQAHAPARMTDTATKNSFMSGKYMPSLIVKVDSLTAELQAKKAEIAFITNYLESSEAGRKRIIPAEMLEVQQVKPLTLKILR